MRTSVTPPLLVGTDQEIAGLLSEDVFAKTDPPVVADGEIEGIRKINDPNCSFSSLYIGASLSKISALSLIHSAQSARTGIPVFIHTSGDDPFFEKEAEKLAVHSVLHGPVSYSKIIEQTKSRITNLQNTTINQPQIFDEGEFISVKIEYFLSGLKSFFDLYIRLSPGKFIKLVSQGESFEIERLKRYVSFGVTHFYLKKSERLAYLDYCSNLSLQLVRSNAATASLQLTQTLHYAEQALEYLRSTEIESHEISRAVKFVDSARELVSRLSEKDENLAEYVQIFAAFDHGVSSALLAYFLFKPLGIETKSIANSVTLACLLHDISLKNFPDLEKTKITALTAEEKLKFFSHPEESAKIISEIPGFNQVTIGAILQHHERRDGRGFPKKLKNGEYLPVAEVVGITDEFSRLIATKSVQSFEQRMQSEVFDGFSFNTISALSKIFFKKVIKTR